MIHEIDLTQRAAAMADAAGLGAIRSLNQLAGGANNRVFRLDGVSGVALLKAYFRHPDDPRDRLGAEFTFSQFAWKQGVRALPQPLACDAEAGLGLFEYVAGRPLRPEEVGSTAVEQAIGFFADLNRNRFEPEAARLLSASEACFRLQEHLYLISKRVERLEEMPVTTDVDEAALDLVENRLVPAWAETVERVSQQSRVEKLSLSELLAQAERCLSPSDFGYHNAILQDDGGLRFVDFEYSGWDDPSKLICDFFCQPALPAPASMFDQFAASVAECMPSPGWHVARARLLLPVYRLKWCCIVLNDFLPAGGRRRQFSRSAEEQEQRKTRQLDKARSLLDLFFSTYLDSRQAA